MIFGHVNADIEPVVTLYIEDGNGQIHEVDAIIDTGYTAEVTLPPTLITSLGLRWVGNHTYMFVDGSIRSYSSYKATVMWDGQPRSVTVAAIDTPPLIGVRMLEGCEVMMRMVDGGVVRIDVVP